MSLNPGLVVFSTLSDIFILGISSPFFSIAESLYTPPKTGEDFAVIKFSPTPKESIGAPCNKRFSISSSSREFETHIFASQSFALSSITLAIFVRYAKSPLSIRIPARRLPIGLRTSLYAFIAFGIPLRRVS